VLESLKSFLWVEMNCLTHIVSKVGKMKSLGAVGFLVGFFLFTVGCASSPTDSASGAGAPADPIATVGNDNSPLNPTEAPAGLPQPGTATPEPSGGILEEVPETGSGAAAGENSANVAGSPLFEQLRLQLTKLGYEGVGLEHESVEALTVLMAVFEHPDAAKRKIKRVYTGASMEYDAKAQAVTINGLDTQDKILNYLKKNIPRR
jgi:hypothetical protein